MIGFKKIPKKLIFIVFTISVILIFLIYIDDSSHKPLPSEIIKETESTKYEIDIIKSSAFYEVADGENISIIFEKFKVPLNTAYKIFRLDKKGQLTNIKPGDEMVFNYLGDDLINIKINKTDTSSLLIKIDENISISEIVENIEYFKSYKKGIIENSFYETAQNSGMPDSIIMDLAYIYGWDIDFVFDIRDNDEFFVIYETGFSNGERIDTGDIIAAKFVNKGKVYFANRFVQDSKKQYFDNDGNNMQKAFLRAPLEFSYISSHFNPNRMHPILHTIRAHNGVDYAAKRGSPVRSTGDGTILFIGRKSGCGNEILIKHSNDYSTRYCHLEGFAKNLNNGKKVKQGQTIGYVGSTGLATGPHLHYEFKIGEKHTDPVKVNLPSAEGIKQNYKESFNRLIEKNKSMLEEFSRL
ncbi:MAG: peptidase M23 [SAR86 cluster bacterium]|jgi:murein DD-endopeptidase MepM/ murein hydrolase activator NlpD|nr:MAG: peptidase M23 [SAR86 cluster bacterium]URQ69674.1 peptidoglycan DD-metalloendopeptidase family protein [SAR86 cluster bacterium]|tara:strand:- start:790 stop:2022 length:1233 start_codon:yes stop_codon:yes gene_type:complete